MSEDVMAALGSFGKLLARSLLTQRSCYNLTFAAVTEWFRVRLKPAHVASQLIIAPPSNCTIDKDSFLVFYALIKRSYML